MHGLMKGKLGLIMGVSNDHSIAWGIAKALAAHDAELAFTYQGEAQAKRLKPLAQSLGSDIVLPCEVEDIASVDAVIEALRAKWGTMDFLVHAIGFTDKNELRGRYADTTRENFLRTMLISFVPSRSSSREIANLLGALNASSAVICLVAIVFPFSTNWYPSDGCTSPLTRR